MIATDVVFAGESPRASVAGTVPLHSFTKARARCQPCTEAASSSGDGGPELKTLWDGPAAYQLVGEVMAHQGYDG